MRAQFKFASILLMLSIAFMTASCGKSGDFYVGDMSVKKLLADYPVFSEEYERYEVSEEDKSKIMALDGKSILVLFGTWCHDSEREIPRLIKLIEKSSVTLSKFQLLAVDLDKSEPSGLAKQQRLKYTPTIILFDGEQELGRVIEKPNTSLAKDLARFTE